MNNKVLQLAAAALGVLLATAPAVSLERSEVPEKYRWDLGSLFAGEAQWVAAKDALRAEIPSLARWQGRLGESPATLLSAMEGAGKLIDDDLYGAIAFTGRPEDMPRLVRERLGRDLHSLWFNANQERTNTILGERFDRRHGPATVVEWQMRAWWSTLFVPQRPANLRNR